MKCELKCNPLILITLEHYWNFLCNLMYLPIFSGGIVQWGGEVVRHARAQEDHWKNVLTFLSDHLKSPKVKSSL